MRSLIRGFTEVFPYAALFRIEDVDYCLIGSLRPLHVDDGEWTRRLEVKSVKQDLERISIAKWTDLAGMCVATTASLRAAVQNDEANTDDNGRVEFLSPLALTKNMTHANRAWIGRCKVDLEELLDPEVSPEAVDDLRSRLSEMWKEGRSRGRE
jgi:hypothetical protein